MGRHTVRQTLKGMLCACKPLELRLSSPLSAALATCLVRKTPHPHTLFVQAFVVAAFAATTVARDCDTYSFCEDPGMTIAEGNFEYGVSKYGHTCLADTKNAQSFRWEF